MREIKFRPNAYGPDEERIYLVDPRARVIQQIDDTIAREIFEGLIEEDEYHWPWGEGPVLALDLGKDDPERERQASFLR